jgi:hypothetical protein
MISKLSETTKRIRKRHAWRQPMTATTHAAYRSALLIVDPYNDLMSQGGKRRCSEAAS